MSGGADAGARPRRWADALSEACRALDVPAATLAVWDGARLTTLAAGARTPDGAAPCQPEDVFRIGSIAKLLTATGVMRWVERGAVRLDTPVAYVLPEWRTAQPASGEAVDVVHLLTHTSGLDGDFFEDTGDGDDCLARYVDACRDLDFLFAPGRGFSYCNAAFPIAARLVERLSGSVWDDTLRGDVLWPLGMHSTTTGCPVDAQGHVLSSYARDSGTGAWRRVVSPAPRALAPCGARPAATAADLARLGHLFASGGRGLDGRQVLSGQAVSDMLTPRCDGPAETFAAAWGIGTMHFSCVGGRRLVGHDGAVDAFQSMLRADPESGVVLALLTNGGDARSLHMEMATLVFGELAGVRPAPPPAAAPDRIRPLEAYAGVYRTRSAEIEVVCEHGELVAHCRPTAFGRGFVPSLDVSLVPIDEERFLAPSPSSRLHVVHRFLHLDPHGVPAGFHFRGRTHPRVR